MFKASEDKCYCAFCKHERFIYRKRHINWINGLLCLFTATLLMFLIWQEFDARVFILFAVSLTLSELFVVTRWRISAVCPFCGFDPIVYMKSPKKAVDKVNAKIEQSRLRPDFYLTGKNPLLNLARRPKKSVKDEAIEKHFAALQASQSSQEFQELNLESSQPKLNNNLPQDIQ